ncbi:MAG: DUF2971 domain-containing protein [Acidobacteriota bacterium]|nr:DUF2971 domain-containing protein [Acidobacteriota bacterium]
MLIYKYTSSFAGKLIVENGSIRFSQVEVLNDPFELAPSLDKFKSTIKNFVRNTQEFKDNTKNMTFIEKEASIQRIVQPSIDEILKQTKESVVLSLTKTPDNPLMWSHYADSHKGVVIGFDYDNYFFHQTEHPQITCSYDVNYSDVRPEFFDFVNFWNMNVSVDDYRNMLLTKSIEWKYEEEVRMFAHPTAATNKKQGKDGFDIYLFDFPKECLKKIIFGSLMSASEKTKIAEIAKRLYPHVELLEAIRNEARYNLKFKTYNG